LGLAEALVSTVTDEDVRQAGAWLFPALDFDVRFKVVTDFPAAGRWITLEAKGAPHPIFIGDSALKMFLQIRDGGFSSPACPGVEIDSE
jgi:hypothetical protein